MPAIPPASPEQTERIDLWTWAVRLFKTRSLAAAACEKGQIFINGQHCRASRRIRVGDEILLRQGSLERRLEVRALSRHRMAAKDVASFCIDHTPSEEYERVREEIRIARASTPHRASGEGRPTKRDRRQVGKMDDLLSNSEPAELDFDEFTEAFFQGIRRGQKDVYGK